jgi:UDP-N-acetylmuramate--alanine ligase
MIGNLESRPLAGQSIYLVGIGGSGMSGLARLLRAQGADCAGTDDAPSAAVDALRSDGIAVQHRDGALKLPEGTTLVVISAAIPATHPIVLDAQRRAINVVKYADALGLLMANRRGVAIAGTHGKSTTTGMLAYVLIQAGFDPSFIVGATCDQIGGGWRSGGSEVLVVEACEYDRSFHRFAATHGVILNVEEDHLDVYGTLQGVIESFQTFVRRLPREGTLLIGHSDSHRTSVTAGAICKVETVGFSPEADWVIRIGPDSSGQHVALMRGRERVCEFVCQVPGDHMAYNSAVAAVTAHELGVSWEQTEAALAQFRGMDRRMQLLGSRQGVRIVTDYAHHPTEVDATLRALRHHYRPERGGGRLICVFQPHQHSRTRFLLDQFTASFSQADIVVVPPIYFSRDSEQDRREVRAEHLVAKLRERGKLALHIEEFAGIVDWLAAETRPNDLVVVMGAGSVEKIASSFLTH